MSFASSDGGLQRLDLCVEGLVEPLRDLALYPQEDWRMEKGDLVQRIRPVDAATTLRSGPTLRVGMNLRIGKRMCHIRGIEYSLSDDGVAYKYLLGDGRRHDTRWLPIGLVR